MKFGKFVVFLLVLVLNSCGENELIVADKAFENGDYASAIEGYSQHLRLHPTNVKALYNRGRAFEELKQYEKAMSDFHLILNEQPTHLQANISIGMDLYFRKEDYSQCIKYMNAALLSDRKSAKAYTLRGKSYQRLGQAKKAEQDYNKAISVDSKYADGYYARAGLRIMQDKSTQACTDFKVAAGLGMELAQEGVDKYCK